MKPVLAALKNNLLSIIFGLIAITAVCTLFWPIPQKYALLRTSLNGRAGIAGKLDGLSKAPHLMPILSPDQSSQQTLTVFPAQKVFDAALAAASKVTEQANRMQDAAVAANKHDLLMTGSLPSPDETTRYKFVQIYTPEITGLTRWQKILNSGTRPTQAVIDQRSQQLHDKIISTRVFYTTSNGQSIPDPGSLQQAETEFQSKVAGLRADIALENAKGCQIYMETTPPMPLPVIQSMSVNSIPDAGTIWDAQLAMWVCDDITKQIAKINHDLADPETSGGVPVLDVLHTPIKQLISMARPGALISNSNDQGSGVGSPTPRVYPLAVSGRVSNALYDVVRFKITLIVDASKLSQILHGLEAGQFFTVNNIQIDNVVDPAVAAMNGYRYGDKPVLQVEIDMDELLMRDWMKPFIPDSRQKSIAPNSGASWSGGSGMIDQSSQGGGGDNSGQSDPDSPPP